MTYRRISQCRICDSTRLDVLLELGRQSLTGVFPRAPDQPLTSGPLTLARCGDCGLVQLLHSYDRSELYGPQYGYRSSLNLRGEPIVASPAEAHRTYAASGMDALVIGPFIVRKDG